MSMKNSHAAFQALLLNSDYESLPTPQGFDNLPEGARPYFSEIIRSKPVVAWTLADLQTAVSLAMITYTLNNAYKSLDDGVLIRDQSGNAKAHPAIKIVSDLTALRISCATKLGFSSTQRRNTVVGATHRSVSPEIIINNELPEGEFQRRLAARIEENK